MKTKNSKTQSSSQNFLNEKDLILSEYAKYKKTKKSYSFEETFEENIVYREDEKSIGLSFKKGIDPSVLIDALKKID